MTMKSDGRIVMETNLVPKNPARKHMTKAEAIADGKKVRARMAKAQAILAGRDEEEEVQELPDVPADVEEVAETKPKKTRTRKAKK